MSERIVGQLSLADSIVDGAASANAVLDRISRLVSWTAVEKLLSPMRSGRLGAPAYPSLPMFKALLLQQWYGLSDPGLEEAVADRLSFRRFMGLSLGDRVPDHATLWRFREALAKTGLAEKAFAAVTAQIEASGFVMKQGTIIDASLIPAAVNPPPPPAAPLPPDADGRPASKLVKSPLDPDAAWTAREGAKRCFGYKAHVAMDQGSRIVRRAHLTPANVNETTVADGLVLGDERRVYADKAYDTYERRKSLPARGVRNGIMRRARRFRPLSRWAVRRNALLRNRRAPIEPLFAFLKHVYRFARARYRGLTRNAAALHLVLTAMNLRRWAIHDIKPA